MGLETIQFKTGVGKARTVNKPAPCTAKTDAEHITPHNFVADSHLTRCYVLLCLSFFTLHAKPLYIIQLQSQFFVV